MTNTPNHTFRQAGIPRGWPRDLRFGSECLCWSWALLFKAASSDAADADVIVKDAHVFRQAVAQAQPGTRILLAPGQYPELFISPTLRGDTKKSIVIAARIRPIRP